MWLVYPVERGGILSPVGYQWIKTKTNATSYYWQERLQFESYFKICRVIEPCCGKGWCFDFQFQRVSVFMTLPSSYAIKSALTSTSSDFLILWLEVCLSIDIKWYLERVGPSRKWVLVTLLTYMQSWWRMMKYHFN